MGLAGCIRVDARDGNGPQASRMAEKAAESMDVESEEERLLEEDGGKGGVEKVTQAEVA